MTNSVFRDPSASASEVCTTMPGLQYTKGLEKLMYSVCSVNAKEMCNGGSDTRTLSVSLEFYLRERFSKEYYTFQLVNELIL